MVRRIGLVAGGALFLLVGCASKPEATYQQLTMEQTPLSVRRGIEIAYPGATVRDVQRETYRENGVVHYQIKVTTARGETKDFELAEDGELVPKE